MGNANAIRFEDKMGGEELWMQAELDMLTEVKNNEAHKVTANRLKDIGGDQQISISGNQETQIQKDHNESISGNDSLDVSGDRKIRVSRGQTLQVQQDLDEKISGNRSTQVSRRYSIDVQGKLEITVGSSSLVLENNGDIILNGVNIKINASDKIDVKGNSVNIGGNIIDLNQR